MKQQNKKTKIRLKNNCKQADDYISKYKLSNKTKVKDCFNNSNGVKQQKENKIKQRTKRDNGYGYKVLGAGNYYMTAGYLKKEEDKTILVVETNSKIYSMEYNALKNKDKKIKFCGGCKYFRQIVEMLDEYPNSNYGVCRLKSSLAIDRDMEIEIVKANTRSCEVCK